MQAGRPPFRAVEAGGVPQGHAEALGHAAAFEDQNLRRIACQLVERGAHTLLPRVKGEGKGGFRLLPGGELFFCRCAGGFYGHCASFGQKEKSRETDADGKRPTRHPFPAPNGGFRGGGKPNVPFDVAVTELLFAFQQRGKDRRGSPPGNPHTGISGCLPRRLKFRREAGDSGEPVRTLPSRSFPIRVGPFDSGAVRSAVSLQKIPEIRQVQKSLPEERGGSSAGRFLGKGALFQKRSLPPISLLC